jgi:hypothetical protein
MEMPRKETDPASVSVAEPERNRRTRKLPRTGSPVRSPPTPPGSSEFVCVVVKVRSMHTVGPQTCEAIEVTD